MPGKAAGTSAFPQNQLLPATSDLLRKGAATSPWSQVTSCFRSFISSYSLCLSASPRFNILFQAKAFFWLGRRDIAAPGERWQIMVMAPQP